jgi:hypothetical protein
LLLQLLLEPQLTLAYNRLMRIEDAVTLLVTFSLALLTPCCRLQSSGALDRGAAVADTLLLSLALLHDL